MDLFYKRHKNKIRFALILFSLGIIALIINRLMIQKYSEVAIQTGISFWTATVLLLGTIATGLFLIVLEYIEVRR